MPGYEVIGNLEKKYLNEIFTKSGGVLFRHGFEKLRNNIFRVKQFERSFGKKFNSKYSHSSTSGTAALRIALASLGIGKVTIITSVLFVATVRQLLKVEQHLFVLKLIKALTCVLMIY